MAFNLTKDEFDALSAIYDGTSQNPRADFYSAMHALLSNPPALPSGVDPTKVPRQAEGNVVAWFGAAAQTNRGEGGASEFIRQYTAAQIEVRTGTTVPDMDVLLQLASDNIADAVFRDLLGSRVVGEDGQVYYVVPTAKEIGRDDALETIDVFRPHTSDPAAVWSGNPLYIGLGIEEFWKDQILETEGDTYDLAVALVSFKDAGLVTIFSDLSNLLDLGRLFWGQGEQGRADAAEAAVRAGNLTTGFLAGAYGSFWSSALAELAINAVVAGSEHDDEIGMFSDGIMVSRGGLLNAGRGDDTIVAVAQDNNAGDVFDGGQGRDVFTFTHNTPFAASSTETTVTIAALDSQAPFSAHVTGQGVNAALFNIEELHLGTKADILVIHDLSPGITALERVYGGTDRYGGEDGRQGSNADTIDLSQADHGAVVSLTDGTLSLKGGEGPATVLEVRAFENVVGTVHNDVLTGSDPGVFSDGANRLEGGGGVDTLDGGGGSDTLIFDADDAAVSGGSGFDTGYADPTQGMKFDVTELDLEVIVAGEGADEFTADGSEIVMLSGGAGNDTFDIGMGGGSPTIVWGGDGADKIRFGGTDGSAGILVVQVEGLTEENFDQFDIEQLGLGSSFDWSQIDAVLVNPDASDKVYLQGYGSEGSLLREGKINIDIYDGYLTLDGEYHHGGTFTPHSDFVHSDNYPGASVGEDGQLGILGSYQTSFLGVNTSVTAAAAYPTYIRLSFRLGENDEPYEDEFTYEGRTLRFDEAEYVGEVANAIIEGTPYRTYFWALGNVTVGRKGEPFDSFGVETIGELEVFTRAGDIGPWFIVGGSLQGTAITGGLSYVMPPEEDEGPSQSGMRAMAMVDGVSADFSSALDTSGPTPLRGGSYAYAGAVSNLVGEEYVTRVTAFDTVRDTVVVDGVALDGTSLPEDVKFWEYNGSTVIQYGSSDQVVLRGITVAEWQAGASRQIQGTAVGESLGGTAEADVFAGGGGADTITGYAGDDRINYGSGDDLIRGDAANPGTDTLDLRRFNASEVTFTIADIDPIAMSGRDVLIVTPDGTITLDAQTFHDLGHERSNIEGILFADGILDEAAIRTRAVGDQATIGDDTIIATAFEDSLRGWEGYDTLHGGQGNDSLDGGGDTDRMRGGLGDDTYWVDAGSDVVDEVVGEGIDLVQASVSYTLGANSEVENLILLNSDVLNGTGNGLSNVLTGNDAKNMLTGLGGADRLEGAGGEDILFGGNGDDILHGGHGADSLDGGSGDDTLDGGSGPDRVHGGDGDDVYLVDEELDVVEEALGGGVDLVRSSVSYALGDGVENLILDGWNIIGTGNGSANILTGSDWAQSTLQGLGGSDTLQGHAYADTLDGGQGADRLIGGAGNDTYVADLQDIIVESAGGGRDLVQSTTSYDLATSIEVEDLTLIGTGAVDGFGNAFGNVLSGNVAANSLSGMGGNDDLFGQNGDDALFGGQGNDDLYGGGSDDTLDGGAGSDWLSGGVGNDTYLINDQSDFVSEMTDEGIDLVLASVSFDLGLGSEAEDLILVGSAVNGGGSSRDNRITGNALNNALLGASGNDFLSGEGGDDTLYGGNGNDTLDGGIGTDNLSGDAGNDTYLVDTIGDTILEAWGAGTDTIRSSLDWSLAVAMQGANVENLTLTGSAVSATGNDLANVLTGNAGNNILLGGLGNDALYGGDGADRLDGGAGVDSLSGGVGDDTYVVDAANDAVIEDAGEGTDLVQSSATYVLRHDGGVESLSLLGSTAIDGTGNRLGNTIWGNAASNVLSGLEGDDWLLGGRGNDTLLGGDGTDRLDGGADADSLAGGLGDDTYVINLTTDTVDETGGGGTDSVESSVSHTLLAGLENLTLTGTAALDGTGNAAANVLTGNSGANSLLGLGGSDVLVGDAGNDTLDGGTGIDDMKGGLGNDIYVVDSIWDGTTEEVGQGLDTVQSSVTRSSLAANVESLILTGTLAIDGTGNALSNALTGNGAANSLSGLEGNDVLDGGAGNDALTGGLGNDTFVVDSANDTVSELAGEGIDLVRSAVTWNLGVAVQGANVENLTLAGTLAINGTGNSLANTLIGNGAANVLNGGAGNDRLNGGAGSDSLTGGTGADVFVFANAPNTTTNMDVATDYVVADDQIELDNAVFTTLALGALAAGSFVANTTGAAGDAGDRIIYETDTGNLFYDADGTGTGAAAIQFARLSAGLGLTINEFTVI